MKKLVISILLVCILLSSSSYSQWQSNYHDRDYLTKLDYFEKNFFVVGWGGITYSTDGGNFFSYTIIDSLKANQTIESVAQIGDFVFAGGDYGLFRSNGFSGPWDHVLKDLHANSLIVVDDNVILGSLSNGVYLSSDAGDTWLLRNNGLTNIVVTSVYHDQLFLYAGTYGGVFRSSNLGLSWESASSGIIANYIVTFESNGNNLIAGTDSGVYLSTNSGSNWIQKNNGLTSKRILDLEYLNGYFYSASLTGIFKTSDLGNTWVNSMSGIPSNPMTINCLSAFDNKVFAGYRYFGIGTVSYTENNGNNWIELNSGLVDRSMKASILHKGEIVSAGTDLYKSSNLGSSWRLLSRAPASGFLRSLIAGGDSMFMSIASSGIFRSTNNGNNWIEVKGNDETKSTYCLLLSGNYLFAGTVYGIYKTSNLGSSWVSVNNGLTDPEVFCLTEHDGIIYAGTRTVGVFTSTNNGDNWIRRGPALFNTEVHTIYAAGNMVFAGTENAGVYATTNNGLNWSQRNNGLTSPSVTSFNFTHDILFANGKDEGIFYSHDYGLNWHLYREGLNPYTPYTYFGNLMSTDKYLFCGSVNGLYRREISDIVAINEDPLESIKDFRLFQNYPNPFNPKTFIRYELRKTENIELRVFDINGREVTTLFNGKQNSGRYEIEFSGSNLPSGIYFYELRIGEFSESKKMTLIK